ncbi:MAG: hypothetical protein NUV97_04385, partial [archaeon]|nr:hypothetical protein [archaeon]
GLNNFSTIESGNTSVGEVWIFSARAYDGTDWSDWVNSSGLTILSAPAPPSGGGGGGTTPPPVEEPPVETCTDSCSSGDTQKECVNSNTARQRSCGNYDADSCLEFGSWSETTCAVGQSCQAGVCVLKSCNEILECGAWSACPSGTQTRSCSNVNCLTTRSCEVCVENWKCSYTQCAIGDEFSYPYGCVDLNSCGTSDNKPSESISCGELSEIPLDELAEKNIFEYAPVNDGDVCNPSWGCSEWKSCNAEYSFKDVLFDKRTASGIQERNCDDKTGCAYPKVESKPCLLDIPIEANLITKCFEDYVEVKEKESGKLISLVKQTDIMGISDFSKIDISFVKSFEDNNGDYCNYCFDGVQNYDEEEVDCGGSCKSCVSKFSFFDWVFWLNMVLWILFGIFIIVLIINERREFSKVSKELFESAKFGTREEQKIERKLFGLFRKTSKVHKFSSVHKPSQKEILFRVSDKKLEELRVKVEDWQTKGYSRTAHLKEDLKNIEKNKLSKGLSEVEELKIKKRINEIEGNIVKWKKMGYYGTAKLEKELEDLKKRL